MESLLDLFKVKIGTTDVEKAVCENATVPKDRVAARPTFSINVSEISDNRWIGKVAEFQIEREGETRKDAIKRFNASF